jgi:hypothetical protein
VLRRESNPMLRFLLLIGGLSSAFAAEPLTKNLYPAGGGHFAISLSACNEKAAVLYGRLANHTDTTWLYVEIQVKVTQGTSTTMYRLNLERIGADGRAIRQRIDGPADQDCTSIRLSDLELISAHSEARAEKKR